MTKRTLRLSLVAATVLILPGVAPAAGQSEAPLESQAPLDPVGAAFWTGTWTGTGGEPGVTSPGTGYTETMGEITFGMVEADDARVVGDWVQVANHRVATSRDPGEGNVGLVSGTARIDNEAGAWVGTWTAYGGQPGGEEWYVLEGEGAYEGLTTVFRFHFPDSSFEGVILPAELPALPDPAEPAE